MKKYLIKNRYSGELIAELEGKSLAKAIELAVIQKTDLRGANLYASNLTRVDLTGANLGGANLSEANLCGADLYGANLTRADLIGANFRGANLTAANLSGANLRGANLYASNLTRVDLTGANLGGANLSEANLSGADLSEVDLTGVDFSLVKTDFWEVLDAAPDEVTGLRQALVEGRVDGSAYEGECACLVGTIANLRAQDYRNLAGLRPDSSRLAERFFLAIGKGDRPQNNQCSKMAVNWIDDWLKNWILQKTTSAQEVTTVKCPH